MSPKNIFLGDGKNRLLKRYMNVRPDDLDDRALVERFKQTGDPECFTALFERHKGRIYALCYRLVQNHALAEELMQETFMRAFKEIDQFDEKDPKSQFGPWLRTICWNLSLSQFREDKRRRECEANLMNQPDHDPLTPEEMLRHHKLEVAIKALPKEVRLCGLLFYVYGYTYEEIVHMTEYSFQQVKNYLRVFREGCRRC